MDQNRALLLLILLIIWFFPDSSSPPEDPKRIIHEHHLLEKLVNSTYGHPGSLTGLLSSPILVNGTAPDGENNTAPVVPTPPDVVRAQWFKLRRKVLGRYVDTDRELVEAPALEAPALQRRHASPAPKPPSRDLPLKSSPPVYQNATGSIQGTWSKLLFNPPLPTTALPNITYPANLSSLNEGKMILAFEDSIEREAQGKRLNVMKMGLRIRDKKGRHEAAVSLHGVHWGETGEMVAVTTGERFDGIFALSHFTLSESQFNQTKELLVPSINKTITEMEQNRYTEAPWTQAPDGNGGEDKPQCEYIVYAQLHPVDYGVNGEPMDLDTLKDIEREMRFPTGSATPKPPPLIASAMIYSPNCGSVLVADGLEGKKLWAIYDQATHFALGAAVLASLQIWVLIRQMNESNTLSTISRVSFWMITMMAVVDGYCFFIFMAAALLLGPATFLAMVTVSFCYLMLSAVFGMRFLVTTYRVQRQSAPATVTIAAPAPTPTPTPVAPPPSNTADRLPMPATAEAQTPLVIPPAPNTTTNQSTAAAVTDEEVNSEIGSLHMKFYFLLVGIFFFTLYVATWPPFFRDLLVHSLLILVNSYWVPQIHRNVMRGCRKALQWEFVFRMSVLRLVPVFYFYFYPKNIFLLDPNPQAVAVISGWVWIQCMVLVSQDVLGPRFLVPSRSLPQVYDYHSALPVDEEAAQAMGSPVDGGRARSFDCVVCMQTVEVPTAGTGDGRDGGGEPIGLLGRRGYMVTPCKHVFHTHCLEGWMRHRLQCPICRNPLPAL